MLISHVSFKDILYMYKVCDSGDHMVVGYSTTYAISAYHQ